MLVIKRDGRKEDFLPEKIYQTVAAASDETAEPLNESDLKAVISEIKSIMKGKEEIHSYQIDIILSGVLYTKGFLATLKKYRDYVG